MATFFERRASANADAEKLAEIIANKQAKKKVEATEVRAASVLAQVF